MLKSAFSLFNSVSAVPTDIDNVPEGFEVVSISEALDQRDRYCHEFIKAIEGLKAYATTSGKKRAGKHNGRQITELEQDCSDNLNLASSLISAITWLNHAINYASNVTMVKFGSYDIPLSVLNKYRGIVGLNIQSSFNQYRSAKATHKLGIHQLTEWATDRLNDRVNELDDAVVQLERTFERLIEEEVDRQYSTLGTDKRKASKDEKEEAYDLAKKKVSDDHTPVVIDPVNVRLLRDELRERVDSTPQKRLGKLIGEHNSRIKVIVPRNLFPEGDIKV